MPDDHKRSPRRMKADTAAARAHRVQKIEDDLPPVLPWKRILAWTGASALVIAAIAATLIYLNSRPKPPVPIDWDRCPTVAELIGTVKATRNGEPVEITADNPIPPNTLIEPTDGATLTIMFEDGSTVTTYPGSRVRTDEDYRQAVTLEVGHLFVTAKAETFMVNSKYGTASCSDTQAHFDLSRSRLRAECERGEVRLENVAMTRKLRVRPKLPGEVGVGAYPFGIKASEADEEMTYPRLEITKVILINADKDTSYPSYNPFLDGATFVQNEVAPKEFDFQVFTNSKNTEKIVTTIHRMTDDGLTPVYALETPSIIVAKQRVFGVFGIERDANDTVVFKGGELPEGEYLMSITPYGPPRDGEPGNGRKLTLRFAMKEQDN